MENRLMRTAIITALYLLMLPALTKAQENIGMATGNYAGISGVWFNPANIADSRYKFDINVAGVSSWYANNYLLVNRSAFINRLFKKDPYNSSYAAVKNDLLEEQWPVKGDVNARVESNIQFPLSFMATTSKRSAIALSINNRTINQVDHLNPELARLFFNELNSKGLNGKDIPVDSLNYRFLNWTEVGFTYSRVLLNSDHHFLKMGATIKWMGANSGGYIRADHAVVNFKDSTTMSLSSPLINYARTERADFGQFRRRDILNNIEDQTFGWDAGIVYEYRAKVEKFKYIDVSLEEQSRRDLNKYMFRIGLSLVDMGKFTLNKKPLTNDHSVDIVNWDFSDVKANDFSDFDTAYSKKVNYVAGAPGTFTFRLPAAMIFNFDLHLVGGFYVNAAIKAPFESFGKPADAYIAGSRWIAVTPRFESRFFGLYLPVSHAQKRINFGATVKFGPLYFGSTNLVEVFSNKTSLQADYHVGFRISVPYGKPSKLSKATLDLFNGKSENPASKHATQQQVDSLAREVDYLRRSMADSNRIKGVQIFINNNGVTSTLEGSKNDSVVIKNNVSDQQRVMTESYNNGKDEIADSLARQLAEKNVETKRLQRDLEEAQSTDKKSKKSKQGKESIKVNDNNEEVTRELERIRKQMQLQNALLIGGGTAAVVASSGNKNEKNDKNEATGSKQADTVLIRDTITKTAVQKTDTIYIREPAKEVALQQGIGLKDVESQNFEPILFANGSAAISPADKKRLADLATQVKQHREWRLVITGMTDGNGSVSANRKMAASRCSAVTNILFQNNVNDNQVIIRSELSDTNNIPDSQNPRRVMIRILTQ